jgi:hypothetical protein
MRLGVLGCLFAAVVFSAVASPASAAVYYTVYKGEVLGGVDPAGDFGGASGLSGAFTAVFAYDADIGLRYTGPYEDTTYGGPGLGRPSPILSATLTINGLSYAFPTAAASGGVAAQHPASGVGFLGSNIESLNPAFITSLLNLGVYGSAIPPHLNAPVVAQQTGPSPPLGEAYAYDVIDGENVLRFNVSLRPTTVIQTDAPLSVVPEPASWAFLILGPGAVGLAARRRTKVYQP